MNKKLWLVGVIILVLVITVIALVIAKGQSRSFAGTVYSPALTAADIKLTDQNGQPFELTQLHGKIVLIYFGYTNCPNECPLTMAKLKQTLELLQDKGADVQVLMVTTDPARDTGEAFKSFLGKFNPTFLGLSGSPAQLKKVYKDYGVAVENNGETHSNRVYVIDRSGNLRLTFLGEMDPSDMASDLTILLRE